MRRSINFLIGDGILESDKDLFFGPISDTDEWFEFPYDVDYPEILVAAKLFTSKSQARKNGYNKSIPDGFSNFIFGKLHHEITILRIEK